MMLWFACAAVVAAAAVYVLAPLFRESKEAPDLELPAETELDRLLDRKSVVNRNIGDLGFEYKMGRLPEADYRQLEAGYKKEEAAVLQKLKALGVSENLYESLEKEIAERKAGLFAYGPKPAGQTPPSKTAPVPKAPRCPSCGAEIIAGKKYCADCGHRLE
jgi:hypothetical protein